MFFYDVINYPFFTVMILILNSYLDPFYYYQKNNMAYTGDYFILF